jgi:hypothetical protein
MCKIRDRALKNLLGWTQCIQLDQADAAQVLQQGV